MSAPTRHETRGADPSATTPDDDPAPVGIAEVAAATGLSQDTLRWYEREGLIPAVPRGPDGRRRYDAAAVRLVQLVVRLKRTGMPVADMVTFVELLAEGAASHGRRLTLLQEQRVRVLTAQLQLAEDLAAIEDKIAHYTRLIAAGQDCGEQPIDDPAVAAAQRRTT